ncbi:cytochrome P450 [Deinococcus sp. KSM4-11]|uniref:cytochrome P450 n=1 Tax=Deinococcus sp. KSM4-11 TaxID=2568654 RepID=UPI0010A2CB28|nr:cytochrome P450 [Deinococcus sp. KSM4-11]THF86598.1 cytochrome P450 [Deinococcus sp. KSM4-11]
MTSAIPEGSDPHGQTRTGQGKCPFPHAQASLTRKPDLTAQPGGPVELDGRGIYRVNDFQVAREVLRSEDTAQAGFGADMVTQLSALKHQPVLYTEGQEHHDMRRDTARYFTPTAVAAYHPFIAGLADRLVGDLVRQGEGNLDDLSLTMAVQVAAQVVGLTDSLLPGLQRRVMAFVEGEGDSEPGTENTQTLAARLHQLVDVPMFYALDVKPAIQARRKQRRDDLISHLLDKDYSDLEILTECLTYGTAGMVTTREFISVAAWHLLQRPELRADYVHGTEPERHAILHEILRLEPVVNTLYRRAQTDMQIGGQLIPQGSVLALNVPNTNADPTMAGEDAAQLCPGRSLPRGVQAPVLSFGDGHHRCPGAFLAIRESDVLLRRLLIWNDLRVVTPPTVTYNEVIKGYELRNFRIALG